MFHTYTHSAYDNIYIYITYIYIYVLYMPFVIVYIYIMCIFCIYIIIHIYIHVFNLFASLQLNITPSPGFGLAFAAAPSLVNGAEAATADKGPILFRDVPCRVEMVDFQGDFTRKLCLNDVERGDIMNMDLLN